MPGVGRNRRLVPAELRPGSLIRAVANVIVAFSAFALLPALVGVLVPLLPSRTAQPTSY